MARPENRWQLLLVADDGRIVPFKRIKGIAVTLTSLLVILGLVCAGLGWRLTAERVRHRRTLDQLADANRQVVRYKSEHELIAAELVLAEARMEKAGLLVPSRQARMGQQPPDDAGDAEPTIDDGNQATQPMATAIPTAKSQPSDPPAETAPATVTKAAAPQSSPAEVTAEPKQPAVALDDLEIRHDAGKKTILAQFRIKNTGPRSSPVAGRCVVVLKTDGIDPETWLAMPVVTLVNGEPDGVRGQAFKISRFKDMEIKAMGQSDPSSYKTATVHVFDASGAKILEKTFPIDLPAPPADKASAATPVQTAREPATTAVPAAPEKSIPDRKPDDQQVPVEDSGEAVDDRPMAPATESDTRAAPMAVPAEAPENDQSLTEGAEPVKKEDTRSRF